MFLRMCLLLLTILPMTATLQAGLWDTITSPFKGKSKEQNHLLRVLVVHDVEGADLEVKGIYSLYDPYKESYISTRFVGKKRPLQAMNSGLKWGEAFPGIYQLKITPEEKDVLIAINNQEYRGNAFIYDIGGSLSIVMQVPVEDYVTALLSGLDVQSLHPETIAALAIVARTNAYYQELNPKTNFWAVDAQKSGYTGLVEPSENSAKAADAVKITRNMMMSHTGIYEGVATPFLAEFGLINPKQSKDVVVSKLSLDEANQLAQQGGHAAQILMKAFPGSTIMLSQ